MPAIRTFAATTLGVICAILASSLLTQQPASAIDKKSRRAFYLTTTTHFGNQALSACAPGYHMASLWEIFEPSSLSYDSTLGLTSLDSGSGPSSGHAGWIRTGYFGSTSSVAGTGNCNTWTSVQPFEWGTAVSLREQWKVPAEAVGPWRTEALSCSSFSRVWCVED